MGYENNHCKTVLNRIFDVEISKIGVLNNKILLIFELLNFGEFSMGFCVFLKLCITCSLSVEREQEEPAWPCGAKIVYKHV